MIWDKAQELGRQIGQSTEYQALRRAEATLREDKDTVAMLDQIQTLARQVDQMVATGQMPDQATAAAALQSGESSAAVADRVREARDAGHWAADGRGKLWAFVRNDLPAGPIAYTGTFTATGQIVVYAQAGDDNSVDLIWTLRWK